MGSASSVLENTSAEQKTQYDALSEEEKKAIIDQAESLSAEGSEAQAIIEKILLSRATVPASVDLNVPGAFAQFKDKDCCTENPDNYKVLAQFSDADGKCISRLVEMTLPKGGADKPHDHPIHYMYIVNGGKLQITHPNAEGQTVVDVIDMPDGAPPILPAGPHQVSNVGETDVKIVFVEVFSNPEMTILPGFISPFDVYSEGYTKLNNDDYWVTGLMTMKSGAQDPPHSHNDHFVYVLEGTAIGILPLPDISQPGAFAEKMSVPVTPGMGLHVPQGHHVIQNDGEDCKLVFFERLK